MTKSAAPFDGLILVDKPAGITSTGVVSAARRAFGTRRVGHAGTLDPDASGLLLVCVGEATKLVRFLVTEQKDYVCCAKLGTETVSDDAASEVIRTASWEHVTQAQVDASLSQFRGGYDQTAPRVSALKKDGKRFYARVRAGENVDHELPVRHVLIHSLELDDYMGQEFTLSMSAGKGFYVRSLVRDVGRQVDSAAHVLWLRRTRVGQFDVKNATSLEDLADAHVINPADALAHLPLAEAGEIAARRILYGQKVPVGDDLTAQKKLLNGEQVRVLNQDGELLAVCECIDNEVLKVIRAFNSHSTMLKSD